jgi:hypothetical protein
VHFSLLIENFAQRTTGARPDGPIIRDADVIFRRRSTGVGRPEAIIRGLTTTTPDDKKLAIQPTVRRPLHLLRGHIYGQRSSAPAEAAR